MNIIALIIISITLATISCFQTTPALSAGKGTNYTDDDWNLTFYDNCGMPVGTGQDRSVRWMTEGKNKYIRFQLKDKDQGLCSSDRRQRHRAPYWERAELKQADFLGRGSKYSLEFDVRFVKGFTGDRETFFQIHKYTQGCGGGGPPVMFKISDGGAVQIYLRRLPPGKPNYKVVEMKSEKSAMFTNIHIEEVIGKWTKIKLVIDTSDASNLSMHFNGKLKIDKATFHIACGNLHFKFGIYRPGHIIGNEPSIVDFDKFNLRILK